VKAQRLDKEDIKQQVQVINDVSTEIKAGRRYILFPEGGYDHSHNELKEFMPGSFKIAKKAKCPIVPVVLYDSFKPFEGWSLRRVTTQLAFLEPIPYEVIADKTTTEIRDMVVDKIQRKLGVDYIKSGEYNIKVLTTKQDWNRDMGQSKEKKQ